MPTKTDRTLIHRTAAATTAGLAAALVAGIAAPALAVEPTAESVALGPLVSQIPTSAPYLTAEQRASRDAAEKRAADQRAAAKRSADAKARAAKERASRSAARPTHAWPISGNTHIQNRWHVGGGMWSSGRHTGVDFMAPVGTPVHATTAGRVIFAGGGNYSDGWGGAYGSHVIVEDAQGNQHLYAHLSSSSVSVGQRVGVGDTVGRSGNTGNSSGPHVHYEVRKSPYGYNTDDVDPTPFLPRS